MPPVVVTSRYAGQCGNDDRQGRVDLVGTGSCCTRPTTVGIGDVPREAVGLGGAQGRIEGAQAAARGNIDAGQSIGELPQAEHSGCVLGPIVEDSEPVGELDREHNIALVQHAVGQLPADVPRAAPTPVDELPLHRRVHLFTGETREAGTGEFGSERPRGDELRRSPLGIRRSRDVGGADEKHPHRRDDRLSSSAHHLSLAAANSTVSLVCGRQTRVVRGHHTAGGLQETSIDQIGDKRLDIGIDELTVEADDLSDSFGQISFTLNSAEPRHRRRADESHRDPVGDREHEDTGIIAVIADDMCHPLGYPV